MIHNCQNFKEQFMFSFITNALIPTSLKNMKETIPEYFMFDVKKKNKKQKMTRYLINDS